MDDDLDLLSNLLSADIESETETPNQDSKTPAAQSTTTVGKRKLTEDDAFIKELEENVNSKKKKFDNSQAKKHCAELIKKHFGDLSDEDDEYNIFSGKEEKNETSNFYSMGLSNKTTWKSKVDKSKIVPNPTVKTNEKFDVYAEPVFGMRMINPCLSMADLKYKMTGRQAITLHRLKQHVASPDVDAVDWVAGGVLVGKSPPKTSAKGSQYCIWTVSDLKPGLKTFSLFLFSSAFTSLWKTNVGTVVGVLNPSVMENSKGQDEACLSVNNGDKIMCWGTSKDFAKCKARKKDGENCTNFVNAGDCEFCVYHVKQEYKKFTGRSEFQSEGGGGLTSLRNKVLGKNEVFYAGQSFTSLKAAKKNPKLVARDNKLLASLSKTGVVVSALATQNVRSLTNNSQSQSRGKKIEDAERMRQLSGQPVYVSGHKIVDQERSNTGITFKSIFQTSSSPTTNSPLQNKTLTNNNKNIITKGFGLSNPSSNSSSKSVSTNQNKSHILSNPSGGSKSGNANTSNTKNGANKLKSTDDDLFDFDHSLNESSSTPRKTPSQVCSNKSSTTSSQNTSQLSSTPKSSKTPNSSTRSSNTPSNQSETQSASKRRTLLKDEKTDASKKKSNLSDKRSSSDKSRLSDKPSSSDKLCDKPRSSNNLSDSDSAASLLNKSPKDIPSQSQAASTIANYFAKKSAASCPGGSLVGTTAAGSSSKRISLSNDLRERKKQIARAKAESLIKHKGGIEKVDPNSLKKSKLTTRAAADFELEIEGDSKDSKVDAFKEMMAKTSRHMNLVDEAHRKEEEEYFLKLEKKEMMEEKMLNTYKVETKAVRCVECKYTWFSASDLCKRDRHTIKLITTFKRFFKCVNCSVRTISFDVVPLRACSNCGVTNWSRAPMMQEKKVNLEHQLCIRGGESKYLSSMNSGGEASLNLLVPE
uniref:Protein MCM10 homolog n=1 Tax=Cacopsylla melanoneura TaxID=428564 RepID=A0A8D8YXD3_9HEMI